MNIDEALEYAQNALELAFENWLETERPSGDCESVHRQWDDSFAHQEIVDELQPVMTLTWEVQQLHAELAQERKRLDWALEKEAVFQWPQQRLWYWASNGFQKWRSVDGKDPRATIDELMGE